MVLAVQNLRVQYGARVLFNDLSFTVEDGERIALAGHNGAGKSTLMKCMAGLNEPDSGSIIKSRHSQVGYLPQEGIHVRGRRLIDEAMSAFADLMDLQERIDALTQEMEKLDPRSAAYSEVLNEIGELELVLHAHDSARLRPRTESILRGLGFKDRDFDRDCGEFSGGWQMRIALAKLLLREPEVLLLDEPTNHLDIQSQRWMEQYLRTYRGGHHPHFPRRRAAGFPGFPNDCLLPRARGGVRGQFFLFPEGKRAAEGDSAAPEKGPGTGNRQDEGVHRPVPLQGYQGLPGAVPHQAVGEGGAD